MVFFKEENMSQLHRNVYFIFAEARHLSLTLTESIKATLYFAQQSYQFTPGIMNDSMLTNDVDR